eukprot:9474452-Pyramimonas_sp.AAC.1
MENRVLKYSVVNKHHMFYHIAQGAAFCNPKFQWCYMAEDFMRHIVKIGAASLMGSPTLKLSQKVCERWRIGRYFEFERGLDV